MSCGSIRNDVILLQWTIDGSSVTDQDLMKRGLSIETVFTSSKISITGLSINNGIDVGCTVLVKSPPYVASKSALFTVSDIPPVTNLSIKFNTLNTQMNISWTEPSCLPVNYSYVISIDNESYIIEYTTTDVQYTVDVIVPCNHYTCNVTVGCWGGISTMSCGSIRNDVTLHWTIDGSSLTNQDIMKRGLSIETVFTSSNISITGLSINNGILVGCTVVVSSPPYLESKSALFTVSDVPPINDLGIKFNTLNTQMNISWTKLSCLPVNYSYVISIENESDIIAEYKTTDLQYTVDVIPCNHYTCNVTVVDIGLTQYESSVSSIQRTAEGGIEDVFVCMNAHSTCILDQKHIIEINSSSVHFIDKANVSLYVKFRVSLGLIIIFATLIILLL